MRIADFGLGAVAEFTGDVRAGWESRESRESWSDGAMESWSDGVMSDFR